MKSIYVIGTNPPCPRCGLLYEAIDSIIKTSNLDAILEHFSYKDDKAKELASKNGLVSGTAKDVIKKLNLEIDMKQFVKLGKDISLKENSEYEKYNNSNWSYELDKFLKIAENNAHKAKILMTPVLVIDGEIKHSGSVPRLHKLINLLK